MNLPSDQSDPTYAYRKALYDFCRRGNVTDYERLDALLYSEYGDRPIGELPKLYTLTNAGLVALAAHVYHQFNESWMRLLEDFVSQYKPLENYSMTESGTDIDKTQGLGVSNTHSKGVGATGTPDTNTGIPSEVTEKDNTGYSVETTSSFSDKEETSVSTYDANPKSVSTRENKGPTGTGNINSSTTTPTGQQGTDASNWGYKNHDHNFSRSGNIGVMTATDMLKNDSEFWSTNDFFSIIASNIASLVTNPYYE